MAKRTGQTFRLLLRALADVSEGKADALFVTTSAREATRVLNMAHRIIAITADHIGFQVNGTKRTIQFPNGRTIRFRGPTTDDDRRAEVGKVFNRYHDGAT